MVRCISVINLLQDFFFTLKDYLLDDGLRVRRDAIEFYKQALGCQYVDTDVELIISRHIECAYKQKLYTEAEWSYDAENLVSGSIICLNIGDLSIKVKLTIAPKSVIVILVDPKLQLCKGRQVCDCSQYIYTNEPFDGAPANALGKEAIRDIVLSLYKDVLKSVMKK